jgi:hypothetical protein
MDKEKNTKRYIMNKIINFLTVIKKKKFGNIKGRYGFRQNFYPEPDSNYSEFRQADKQHR